MEAVFLKILNMSITASYLVLAVVLARLLLKKAPKFITVILWALVAVRLICPFSIESVLSLIPSGETVPADIMYTQTPQIYSGISSVNTVVNNVIMPQFYPDRVYSANPLQIWVFVASVVWVVGIVAMLLYTLISYIRIRLKVREAVKSQDNIYECDRIDTPFILGIIKPRIYLPSAMAECDREYVIAHEKAHLKRRDHLWKPLGFLLLAVYWFNPVLWVAYILLCRDIELACDEKVIKQMGEQNKKPYSEALINCSVPRKMVAACPLAFGETGVKGRIKSVLNYKKPAFWVIITAVVLGIAVAVCFMTNPNGKKITDIPDNFVFSDTMFDGVEELVATVGETHYKISYEEDIEQIIEQLKKVRVRKDEISKSRSEERDKTNSIVFETYTLYFNEDFTEIWGIDGLKPSFSYKVLNKNVVKKAFKIVSTSESTRINQALGIANVKTESKLNDVSISVKSFSLEENNRSIEIEMRNNSDKRYSFGTTGNLYYKQGDKLINCRTFKSTKDRHWAVRSAARIFNPNETITIEYSFYLDDVTREGIYRLESEAWWVEFELKRQTETDNTQSIEKLKEKYPEYFGLDTTNGLYLYVSEFAQGSYKCQLLSGREDFHYPSSEIHTEKGATLEETKAILSTYNISGDKLYVIPHCNPLSSYYYQIDDEYLENLKTLFGSTVTHDLYIPFKIVTKTVNNSNLYFNATVLEIYDNDFIVVRPDKNEEEYKYAIADRITVNIKNIINYGKTTFNEGDKIQIAYDGEIIVGSGAQINNASSVYLIEDID